MSVPRPGPSLNLKITRACKGTPPHYQPSTFLFQMVPFPPFFSQTAKVDTGHHQSTMHISLARGLFPGENRNNHCSASASTQVGQGIKSTTTGPTTSRQQGMQQAMSMCVCRRRRAAMHAWFLRSDHSSHKLMHGMDGYATTSGHCIVASVHGVPPKPTTTSPIRPAVMSRHTYRPTISYIYPGDCIILIYIILHSMSLPIIDYIAVLTS